MYTTGVISTNRLCQEYVDEWIQDGVDIHYEQWLVDQWNPSDEARDNYCDDSPVYLIGAKITAGFSQLSWEFIESEDFHAILSFGNGGILQVIKSPYFMDCNKCSPCYPNQGDLSSDGYIQSYCPRPDMFPEEFYVEEFTYRKNLIHLKEDYIWVEGNNIIKKIKEYHEKVKMMEYHKKFEIYKNGNYSFPPPPVQTVNWDDKSWIKWIDSNGKWLT